MTDAAFTRALSHAATPETAFAALHDLARARIGCRLITVMMVDTTQGLARRAFTSHPRDYPASGTKPIHRNPWFETMERGEIFIAPRVTDHPDQFPDHALIASLGCGSVANLPVHSGGQLVGAVNLLDAEDHFRADMADRIEDALALPSLAALMVAGALDR